MCGRHAKIVDNNRGSGYPPQTLLSFKALHEARVSLEHEGLYPPVGWLHELSISQSPLFVAGQKIQLGKLNLVYGMNCTGKTAMVEWIEGFFNVEQLDRWIPMHDGKLDVRLSLLNPKPQTLRLEIKDDAVKYSIDDRSVAFIPISFRVFRPKRFDYGIRDDREMLAQSLGVATTVMDQLLEEVNRFPHARASNLRFERDTDEDDEEIGTVSLCADVQGTLPGLSLRSLSGRESERILLELATAAARLAGKYCPTILVIDECVSIIFEGFFDFYSHHLLDPSNQFQTLMCIAERDLDLQNVRWNGWQVIRTSGKLPSVRLSSDMTAA